MKKLYEVLFVACVLLFFSANSFAEIRAEGLIIDKVTIKDKFAIVSFSNLELENHDACSSASSSQQATIDLESNDLANYLYAHVMTAMVSNKSVHLSLDGCVYINDLESLPAIVSVEVIN